MIAKDGRLSLLHIIKLFGCNTWISLVSISLRNRSDFPSVWIINKVFTIPIIQSGAITIMKSVCELWTNFDGVVQDSSVCRVLAMGTLQSCAKPSICHCKQDSITLTYSGQVLQICISELGQYWFRCWLTACHLLVASAVFEIIINLFAIRHLRISLSESVKI